MTELLFIGSGHSSTQLLRHLGTLKFSAPLSITLLNEYPYSIYSGYIPHPPYPSSMTPGVISKQYHTHETMLDNTKLAKHANATFRLGRAESIDWETRQVICSDTTVESTFFKSHIIPDIQETKKFNLSFDYLVIDIGSTSRNVDEIKGVKEFTIPTRPISQLVYKLEHFEKTYTKSNIDLVVVGAGAAGIELVFATRQRFRDRIASVTLIDQNRNFEQLLGEHLGSAIEKACEAHKINVFFNIKIGSVESDAIILKDGKKLPFDLCLWATGAAPSPFIEKSGLKTLDGWIEVNSHLQSTSHSNVFAAGDCIALEKGPKLAKSGVYAVREGPILEKNVISWIFRDTLKCELVEYVPQKNFLKLINYGDGTACSDYYGYVMEGTLIWYLKDWIDKKFMYSFPMCLVDPSGLKDLVINTSDKMHETSPLLIQKN